MQEQQVSNFVSQIRDAAYELKMPFGECREYGPILEADVTTSPTLLLVPKTFRSRDALNDVLKMQHSSVYSSLPTIRFNVMVSGDIALN